MQSTSTQSPSSPSLVNTVRQKNRSIAEWFDENRCVGSENMQKEFQKTTFRDNDGVLRCMDSWLPAPDDGYPYLLPGSYELYLSSLKTLSITAGASSNASVKILCDWELLWRHLADDTFDELAVQDDLLRASIDFFMHKKTICIYWILIFYIFIFLDVVVGYIALGDAAAAASLNNAGYYTNALNHFCIGIYYVFLQRLYVGCGGPWQPSLGVGVIQPHNDNHCLDRRPKYMHWSGSLRHFFRLAFLEVRAMLFGGSKKSSSVRIPGSKKHQSATSFNHLLNIALKYIHRHCETSPLELQQSRRIYKAAFVGIFAFLSIYIVLTYCFNMANFVIICIDMPSSMECKFLIVSFFLTGGYVLNVVALFLLFGSITIGVVGLMYGSSLAYCMVSSWMNRYAGLRRVVEQDADVDVRL